MPDNQPETRKIRKGRSGIKGVHGSANSRWFISCFFTLQPSLGAQQLSFTTFRRDLALDFDEKCIFDYFIMQRI